MEKRQLVKFLSSLIEFGDTLEEENNFIKETYGEGICNFLKDSVANEIEKFGKTEDDIRTLNENKGIIELLKGISVNLERSINTPSKKASPLQPQPAPINTQRAMPLNAMPSVPKNDRSQPSFDEQSI